MHHECASRVGFEKVIHEWDDDHNGGRWCIECETGESLDETGNEGGRKMGGGKEGIEETEEAGSVLRMEQVGVQEGVEFSIELRIVQILLLNEIEETRESEK